PGAGRRRGGPLGGPGPRGRRAVERAVARPARRGAPGRPGLRGGVLGRGRGRRGRGARRRRGPGGRSRPGLRFRRRGPAGPGPHRAGRPGDRPGTVEPPRRPPAGPRAGPGRRPRPRAGPRAQHPGDELNGGGPRRGTATGALEREDVTKQGLTDGRGDGRGRRPRALVYGDVDMNIIDGSAVWAQSMVQALAAAGCRVTLLLKAEVTTDRLVAPLEGVPGVEVRRPYEEGLLADLGPRGLTPDQAVGLLADLDGRDRYDLVVVRGRRLAVLAAQSEAFKGRLWTYLTDVPQSVPELTAGAVSELTDIAVASRFLLCQTEDLRCFLESAVPAAAGKSVLFPPVVVLPEDLPAPAGSGQDGAGGDGGRPLRLVYTGKFAPRWNTLEMTRLPEALAERGVAAELDAIGDKIHRDNPDWARRMSKALEGTQGVTWHGGKPRAQALRLSARADVRLSWRDPDLDASLELSTKVLEMGALGLPVVLNRTPAHEALLGEDYPLFAEPGAETEDVADVLTLAADPAVRAEAAERCR